MNRILALAAAVAFLLAPGCFGELPGTIHTGDVVVVSYEAHEANGTFLAQARNVTLVVGHGASILGPDGESRLVGHRANETFTVETTTYGRQSVQEAQAPTVPARIDAPTPEIANALGHDPAIGDRLSVPQQYAVYDVVVTATDNTTTVVQVSVPPHDYTDLGLRLEGRIDGDNLTAVLVPSVGSVVHIDAADALSGRTVLGTPPGWYRVAGVRDGLVLFDYNPYAPDFDRVVRVDVTVQEVSAQAAELPPGQYGVRRSPQVEGDPRLLPV